MNGETILQAIGGDAFALAVLGAGVGFVVVTVICDIIKSRALIRTQLEERDFRDCRECWAPIEMDGLQHDPHCSQYYDQVLIQIPHSDPHLCHSHSPAPALTFNQETARRRIRVRGRR